MKAIDGLKEAAFFAEQIDDLVKRINHVVRAPHNGAEWIIDESGECVANVGAYVVEHRWGGPKLCRIADKSGALIECTPTRPARDAYFLMQVFFAGMTSGISLCEA